MKAVIFTLSTLLIVSLFFVGITTSATPYDPWVDTDDDGDIDIYDIVYIAGMYGSTGTPINKTALLLEMNTTLNLLQPQVASLATMISQLQSNVSTLETSVSSIDARVGALEGKLNVEAKWFYRSSSGPIVSTRSGDYVLIWDAINRDFLLNNTSVDWLDYWYINKGVYTQGAISGSTTNFKIIDWAINDDAAEIHFGQADGTGGYVSIWIQYANGAIVGHYIKH